MSASTTARRTYRLEGGASVTLCPVPSASRRRVSHACRDSAAVVHRLRLLRAIVNVLGEGELVAAGEPVDLGIEPDIDAGLEVQGHVADRSRFRLDYGMSKGSSARLLSKQYCDCPKGEAQSRFSLQESERGAAMLCLTHGRLGSPTHTGEERVEVHRAIRGRADNVVYCRRCDEPQPVLKGVGALIHHLALIGSSPPGWLP